MITYAVCDMGGTVARGCPSEDAAIAIAVDMHRYNECGYGTRAELARREVTVVREPGEYDEAERPSIYVHNRLWARVNPEERRDCCGCRPRLGMAE